MNGFPRKVLLKIKWSMDNIDQCTVDYINRGSPGDIRSICGEDIEDITKSYLILKDDTHIPYHRISKITLNDEVLWIRDDREIH